MRDKPDLHPNGTNVHIAFRSPFFYGFLRRLHQAASPAIGSATKADTSGITDVATMTS